MDGKVTVDDKQGGISEKPHLRATAFIRRFILETSVGKHCHFSLVVAGNTICDGYLEQDGH